MNDIYSYKYLKYKTKYLNLQNKQNFIQTKQPQKGGNVSEIDVELSLFNKDDTRELLSIINEDSYLYLGNGKKWTIDSASKFIQYCEKEERMIADERKNFYWAIRLDKELVGMVGIHTVTYDKNNNDNFFISFFIAKKYRRRGYALISITQAMKLFHKLNTNVNILYADIHNNNNASAKTLLKCGFNPILKVNKKQLKIYVRSKTLLRFNYVFEKNILISQKPIEINLTDYILDYKTNYILAKKEIQQILNKIDYPYLRYYVSKQDIIDNFKNIT